MTIKKERKNSFFQICHRVFGKKEKEDAVISTGARVGKKEKRREMADFLVLPRLAMGLKNGAGSSGKTW